MNKAQEAREHFVASLICQVFTRRDIDQYFRRHGIKDIGKVARSAVRKLRIKKQLKRKKRQKE